MQGQFKFVLSKTNKLYLGLSRSDFHQDIAYNLPGKFVKAAGWLHYRPSDGWWCNGSSVGYGVSFSHADACLIEDFLKKYTPSELLDLFVVDNRMQFEIF